MKKDALQNALRKLAEENDMLSKGPLGMALVLTRKATESDAPLIAENMLTPGGGQVSGVGKARVRAILKDYGIERVLAEEGGRTSRGSIDKMRRYVDFLNGLRKEGMTDFKSVEEWWVERVRDYFAGKPFVLRLDSSKSLRAAVRNLIDQAQERQEENPGTQFAGAVLHHLVGAKIEILLEEKRERRGSSVADESSGASGDFVIDDVVVHVTTAPSEALIRKCVRNLEKGLRPMIVTTTKGVLLADGLAGQAGIADRVDVFEAEQFIAGNLYEMGGFKKAGRRKTAGELVAKYNEIIDEAETDPSLKIQIGE